jgi:putative Mg2+ transporter-C (MgtC) family protein
LKLILAVLCGGLVGLIKGNNKNSVNFSTLILTCFTAALFVLIFSKMNISMNMSFINLEISTATIITGYAIIGGSIIIGQKASLHSIINALTIWAVAGMGVAIGSGIFIVGIVAGILMSILLNVIHRIFLTNIE